MTKLFDELKRRNVVRVGIAYIILGWVVLQVGDVLFDMFGTPDWVGKTLAVLLALGFPFACLFAWAFELTPEGIKKTKEVDHSRSITHSTGRRLDRVIIIALVVALGYFIWERQTLVDPEAPVTETGSIDRSIAVLPFVNMSSDQEQEWFADGLTEEILNALARTPDLLVASRTSSFQYKGQNTDISAIAKALGVAHVLEGSVRRGGDRLRVTAQLIRAHDGFHLWSETFDRAPEDVIAIQEDVAFEIANALDTAMDPEALKQMVSAGTSSVSAYEAYLEGLAHGGRSGATGDPVDWGAALHAFERATEIDPNFAEAWFHQMQFWESQLGVTDVGSDTSKLPADEKMSRFVAAADAAIRAAADDDRVLLYKATKADGELRFRDGIWFAEQFIEKYPNDVTGYSTLTSVAASMRDAEVVRRHYPQMRKLAADDAIELNVLLNNLLFVGLPGEAAEMAREILPKFPQHGFITYQSHRILLWNGATAEAKKWIPAIRGADFPDENIWLVELRQACAEGDSATAEPLARRLLEFDSGDSASDSSLKFIAHQIMGRPEEAHAVLLDLDLGIQALRSYLGYPYFNHTLFPQLAEILEKQGVERPYVDRPPYACKT